MIQKISFALVIALLGSTLASASPLYSEVKSKLVDRDTTKTRLFLYRPRKLGSIYHPDISLNGKKIWESESGAVCMIDVAPGRYLLSTSENKENNLSFYAYPGEIKYIGFGSRPGNFAGSFMPQLLLSQYAERQIEDLDYMECKP